MHYSSLCFQNLRHSLYPQEISVCGGNSHFLQSAYNGGTYIVTREAKGKIHFCPGGEGAERVICGQAAGWTSGQLVGSKGTGLMSGEQGV